jgi:hypothetical protein
MSVSIFYLLKEGLVFLKKVLCLEEFLSIVESSQISATGILGEVALNIARPL